MFPIVSYLLNFSPKTNGLEEIKFWGKRFLIAAGFELD